MAIDNRIYKVIQRERKRDCSGANGVYMVLVVMINMSMVGVQADNDSPQCLGLGFPTPLPLARDEVQLLWLDSASHCVLVG